MSKVVARDSKGMKVWEQEFRAEEGDRCEQRSDTVSVFNKYGNNAERMIASYRLQPGDSAEVFH